MQRFKLHRSHVLALICTGLLATGPALAEKPAHAGGGKDKKHEQSERHDGGNGGQKDRDEDQHGGHDGGQDGHADGDHHDGGGLGVTIHFGDGQRESVRNYYSEQVHSGHCPPGLAKKNNGCMPPGQARKWSRGQPLPPDVIFYDLPPEIVIHLGTPPPLHRFVRVANDILLIAVGTGMVIDAIEDLGNL